MYSYARSLQGKCIPRLMAAGNLCGSMFAFLATSPQGMGSIPCIGFHALFQSENSLTSEATCFWGICGGFSPKDSAACSCAEAGGSTTSRTAADADSVKKRRVLWRCMKPA